MKIISVVHYFIVSGITTHSIVYMILATFTTSSIFVFFRKNDIPNKSIFFVGIAKRKIQLKIHRHNFLDRIQNIFGIHALLSTSISCGTLRNVLQLLLIYDPFLMRIVSATDRVLFSICRILHQL